jgi:hypothetical protein
MSSRQTKLRPLLRWCGVVTLLAWLGAQTLCQAHCLFDTCQGETGETGFHAATASESHHGDESPSNHKEHGDDASCATLKSALSGNTTPSLIAPEFSLIYTLAPIALTFDASTIKLSVSFSRQVDRQNLIFTPEVCLGSALHSLAPPLVV